MKKVLLLPILSLFWLITTAQTVVTGKVKDNKGHSISGASIAIKDSYDGATSDSTGKFSLQTTEKGSQVLLVTYIGYKVFEQQIELTGTKITIDAILKEEPNELKAVVVTAGSFEASDTKKSTVLSSLDIVTTAGANADVTSAMKTLPGTQQVGESEGLFVRGGTATETKIFMDGTNVNNFFYSSVPGIASRGRFNPFLFKGTMFSTGGYSALYGGALSSALILESIDLPDQTSANLGVTFLSLSGGFQQLSKNKKSSWGVTYAHSDLSLAFKLIKQKQEYVKDPVSNELDANFRIKTSKTGMIKYYGYFFNSDVSLRYASIDSVGMKEKYGVKNVNMYHNLSWKEKLGTNWKMFAGLSYSTNKDNINGAFEDANNDQQDISSPVIFAIKNFNVVTRGQYLQSRLYFERRLIGLSAIRFGGEYSHSNEKSDYTLYNGVMYPETVKQNLIAGFTEADIYITNDLAAKVGGRVEHSEILQKVNFAPRISLAYKFYNGGQAGLAYGIFYQDPERKYLPTPVALNFSKATHYIAQYQKTNRQYTFRAEVFYKKYDELYKTAGNANRKDVAINNNGFGDAKGVEIFWRDRKTIKNLDYWISYSYLDTKRDFLNYPAAMEPSFATNHTASFVAKKFITKWKTGFNASYNFATGRPYYRIAYDINSSKYAVTDEGKTINYNTLSFSVNYLPFLGKPNTKTFAVIVFSMNNVLGQNQVYTYNYSYDGARKEPVGPPSKRFFFIGIFLDFGIDRTDDAINNNL